MSAASSVTSDLSLEDLIQGLRDTSCVYLQEEREVLIEEWNPSSLALGWAHLRHILCLKFPVKTDYSFPLHDLHEIRPRLISSCVMSCFPWDHTGFLGEFFFSFLASLGLLIRTSLFAAIRGYSVIAAHLFSNPVLLLSRSQALGHSGSVVVFHQLSCRAAFVIVPNQVWNTYLYHWIKRENTLERIWNASLLHETWHHGLFMRRLIEVCALLQATSWDQDWFRFPSQVFLQHLNCPAMWLCSCSSFWNPH